MTLDPLKTEMIAEQAWKKSRKPYSFTDDYKNAAEQDAASKKAIQDAVDAGFTAGRAEGVREAREAVKDCFDVEPSAESNEGISNCLTALDGLMKKV